jgi:hypothetical protein
MGAMTMLAAATSARASEGVMLQAGESKGPHIVVSIDRDSRPRAIVLRTIAVGTSGSRIEIFIDKAKAPTLSEILAANDCKYTDAGSVCEVRILQTDAAYRRIAADFRAGHVAHVNITEAGVMKMDKAVSLRGTARALR